MSNNDIQSFNEKIIEEFRANNGKVAMFADYPVVILHTIGAKSGSSLLVPLVLTINQAGEEDRRYQPHFSKNGQVR